MPIPKPQVDEKEKDFIGRCISELGKLDPKRDDKQIQAICYQAWRNRKMLQIIYVPIDLQEGDLISHIMLYVGKFKHPMGEFELTKEKLENAIKNFKNKIGVKFDDKGKQVLPINYNHSRSGSAEEGKLAGLIKDLELDGNKLNAKMWFNNEARERIQKKEYMWVSAEFAEDFEDEKGAKHGFTVTGMGLTNIPFLRDKQHAIKLSEDGYEDFDDFKEWDTKYINDLPDSAFAVIVTGGEKDSDGKTTPRSLRKLPYKDSSGKIDISHLRNALTRLSQTNLSPSDKSKAKAVLIKAAKQVGVGDYAEYEDFLKGDQTMEKIEQQIRELFGLKDEDDTIKSLETLKESSNKIDKIVEIEKQVKQLTEDKEELEKQNKELQEKVNATDDKVVLTKSAHQALVDGMKEGQQALKKLNDKEAVDQVEADIKAGKLHPKQRISMIKLAQSDRTLYDETVKNMEEGSVNFEEIGSGEEGEQNDGSRQKLTDEITSLAKKEKITFTEARDRLREEKPELFKE